VISGDEGTPGAFWDLVDQCGFFPLTFGQQPDPTTATAPTQDLGVAFVVAWNVPYDGGVSDTVREVIYPNAAGGPLTYMPAGQTFFGGQHTQGGWYRAAPTLTATLAKLGLSRTPAATPPRTRVPQRATRWHVVAV
jgi:hypothetical protein